MDTGKGKIKILVTGGGGFVGLALVRRLVESGYEVASFSRAVYKEHQALGVRSIQGNICNETDIEEACKGMDAVFHVAACVGIWGDYKTFYDINVLGTYKLIEACKKNGVQKLIFTSSASVVFNGSDLINVDETIGYPRKIFSNYASTKARAEQLVLNANSDALKTISLRPHLIWGPGDTQLIPKIIRRAKSGRFRKIGSRDVLIDTVYIDNLIDAQIMALEKIENEEVNGRAFFITNGEPVPTWDFINAILKSVELQAISKKIPKSLAWIIAWILEKMHLLFHIKQAPFITRFMIEEICTSHWFDISGAKRLLDYSPKVDFQEGIRKFRASQSEFNASS